VTFSSVMVAVHHGLPTVDRNDQPLQAHGIASDSATDSDQLALLLGVLPGERPSRQVGGLAPGVPRGVFWIAWALRCSSRRACASATDQSMGAVAGGGCWLRRCRLRAMSHCPAG